MRAFNADTFLDIFPDANTADSSPYPKHISLSVGFTLLELLIAVGIVGILSGLAMPLYSQYMIEAIEARVESDLRTVAFAEHAYFADTETYVSCENQTCAERLPGIIHLSSNVLLKMTADSTGFTGTATHPNIDTSCSWDSKNGGAQGCGASIEIPSQS